MYSVVYINKELLYLKYKICISYKPNIVCLHILTQTYLYYHMDFVRFRCEVQVRKYNISSEADSPKMMSACVCNGVPI